MYENSTAKSVIVITAPPHGGINERFVTLAVSVQAMADASVKGRLVGGKSQVYSLTQVGNFSLILTTTTKLSLTVQQSIRKFLAGYPDTKVMSPIFQRTLLGLGYDSFGVAEVILQIKDAVSDFSKGLL